MNHLAHFFLSGDDENVKIGNFIADFITNKDMLHYTEGVVKGVKLHRAIDAFTDAHPQVKRGTKRLHPMHHKYAPVIVDIYYDFLLAKNWDLCAEQAGIEASLRGFIDDTYAFLIDHKKALPERLQKRIHHMINDDWLMQFTTFEGLNRAFLRVEKAAAFPGNFGNAAAHLEEYLAEFDVEFRAFFPDLQRCVSAFLAQH